MTTLEIIPVVRKSVQVAKVTAELVADINSIDTNNGRIRYMAAEGYATRDIAKILGLSYQRCYNCLKTPLKGR